MKRILMLGAGPCQINCIKKIKSLGHLAYVADYNLIAPGKEISDVAILADVFSYDAVYKAAQEHKVEGLLTSGTDQPVLMVSQVAEALDLPAFISKETALHVTNKAYMKELFHKNNIPTVSYALIKKDFVDSDLNHIAFPAVIKPVDSQGQRGIYKVKTIDEIRQLFDQVLSFSRSEIILVESYYKNKEVTVSGWVEDSKLHILTITDRVTFSSDEHIGVCLAHEYPSIHLERYRDDFFNITRLICQAFEIKNGPIYFQYLVGDEGVKVNEIACRLGGAYEDVSIPYLTGVDVLAKLIHDSINEESMTIDYKYNENQCLSTQLFFCEPGLITYMTPIDEILELPFVISADYNYHLGDEILKTENASARAGHFMVVADDEEGIVRHIEAVYSKMKILSGDKNLVLKGKRYYR